MNKNGTQEKNTPNSAKKANTKAQTLSDMLVSGMGDETSRKNANAISQIVALLL